jgi:hypothetical protein
LSPYAKVIAILIQNNFFAENIKIQIFPKSWLREVHACQKILKFEVFIIFGYFLVFFLHRWEGVGMRGKMERDPLVRVDNTNRD